MFWGLMLSEPEILTAWRSENHYLQNNSIMSDKSVSVRAKHAPNTKSGENA